MTVAEWRRRLTWLVLVNILITAGLVEIALRAQQRLGPVVDLNVSPQTIMIGLSDELNHVPEPGEYWDRDLIRQMAEPNPTQCTLKFLFMGDSFMQGLGLNETVPYHVRSFFNNTLGKELCVFN